MKVDVQKKLFTDTVKISAVNRSLYFPYEEILVNGYQILHETASEYETQFYTTIEPDEIINEIFVLEGIPSKTSALTEGFVDLEIIVNGVHFIRRCEHFFTPEKLTESAIRDFFNLIAPRYDSLIDKELNRKVIRIMLKQILYEQRRVESKARPSYDSERIIENINILDYGIGTGISYEIFKEMKIPMNYVLYGCDISDSMLEICKAKGFFNLKSVKYAETDYPSNFFDAVLGSFVVHYFIDNKPYKEINRILKPSGVFIFNTRLVFVKDEKYVNSRLTDKINNPLPLKLSCGVKRKNYVIETKEKKRLIPIYICKNHLI